jgi:hypothetical protein
VAATGGENELAGILREWSGQARKSGKKNGKTLADLPQETSLQRL